MERKHGPNISQIEQKKRKIPEMFSDRRRTLFGIATALATVLTVFDRDALAKITPEQNLPSNHLTFHYKPNKPEFSDEDVFIKYTTLTGLVEYGAKTKLHSPLFESIRSHDIKSKGVNYRIDNQAAFREFLEGEIEHIRIVYPYFSPVNKSYEWDPVSVCELAAYIISRNMRYELNINSGTPGYDKELKKRINAMPLDEIIIKEKRGVCRHAAALYEAIVRELASMSNKPYFQNFYIDELSLDDVNHAQNVVFSLAEEPDYEVRAKERDIPFEKQKNLTIRYCIIDITPGISTKSFSIKDPGIGLLINAWPNRYSNLQSTFEDHMFPVFSADDRREVLKGIVAFQTEGNVSFPALDTIFKSYEDEIAALRLKGDEEGEQKKREEMNNYVLTAKGILHGHKEKMKNYLKKGDDELGKYGETKGRTRDDIQQEIEKTEAYLLKLDSN